MDAHLPNLELLDAWRSARAREFFVNVWPMYVHEISGFDTDFYTLDASGKWLPDIAPDWVADETPAANLRAPAPSSGGPYQRAHVIAVGGKPIGFACIGLAPFRYMRSDADVVLAELFVAKPHRGQGAAQRAVEHLLDRYPGRWHLSAIHDNARAIRFWRKTLGSLPVRDLLETADGHEVTWSFVTEALGA